jgi:hypothetical protein
MNTRFVPQTGSKCAIARLLVLAAIWMASLTPARAEGPPPVYLWAERFGGAGDDAVSSIEVDAADRFFIKGQFGDTTSLGPTNLTGGGPFVSRLDGDGNVVWARRQHSMLPGQFADLVDADGNTFHIGAFEGTITIGGIVFSNYVSFPFDPAIGIYLAKRDFGGNLLFANDSGWAYAGQGKTEFVNSLKARRHTNDRLFIAGRVHFQGILRTPSGSFGHGPFLGKFNESGNLIAASSFPYPLPPITLTYASPDFFVDRDGHFRLWAQVSGSALGSISYLATDDHSSPSIVMASFMIPIGCTHFSGAFANQGFQFISGEFSRTNQLNGLPLFSPSCRAFLSKISPSGAVSWFRQGDDLGTLIGVDLAGNSFLKNTAGLVKYDRDGNMRWMRALGPLVAVDKQGQIYEAGVFSGTTNKDGFVLNSAGSNDIFVARIAAEPSLLSDPQSQTNFERQTIALMADAIGTIPLHFQWQYNGVNLSGQTNPMLVLPDVQPGQSGNYTLLVSNVAGVVTSAVASVTVIGVNDPPVADASATASSVIAPNNAAAMVLLDGRRSTDPEDDPLSFAWTVAGTPVPPQPSDLPGTVTALLPVGTHLVTLVVNDGELSATNTVTVRVLAPADAVAALAAQVSAANLSKKVERELLKDLERAGKEFDHGHIPEGVHALREFEAAVRKWAAKGALNAALAASWLAEAERIIAAVSLCAAVEALQAQVTGLGLERKFERQLLDRLEAACRAFDLARPQHAVQKLKEFQKLVTKAAGKKIAHPQAQLLISAAQAVIDSSP